MLIRTGGRPDRTRVHEVDRLKCSRTRSNETAVISSTPLATCCQYELTFISVNPLFSTPMIIRPSTVPTTLRGHR